MAGGAAIACNGKVVRGWRCVADDAIRCLTTVRGTLLTDPEKGLGLTRVVFSPADAATIPAYADDIEAALGDDDRIASVDASVDVDEAGVLVVDVRIDLAAGPSFRLIGPVSDIQAELLS